ncbi:hypothetical protein RF11_07465 [Thelohanellus kitauei]|uniref:Uncharacterized protein n=1 Tax=Thelohanellus kitauei TaxID=669202 RepID=A0A0C2MFI2_THEKT|nr:hypothetical protein RF11_07465 [Thelohanellus kitauei]
MCRHYVTKHADLCCTISTEERPTRVKNIAKHSNSLCNGEFVKKCKHKVLDQICKEHRKKFEDVSLSKRTSARRIEANDEDQKSKRTRSVHLFQPFAHLLNVNSTKPRNPPSIAVNAINDRDTTTREDKLKCMENTVHEIKLPWNKMTSITIDDSPSLTGKKFVLLKRISDHATEIGKFLRPVCYLRREILMLLEWKGNKAEYPQLRESLWLPDLAFALDLFEQMEDLSIKPQGNGVFAHEMHYEEKPFLSVDHDALTNTLNYGTLDNVD